MSEIISVRAREILDSRGDPTIETEVTLISGVIGKASVPSGKSTGRFEAVELRDDDKKRFKGKGVLIAVRNVNDTIADAVIGMDSYNQFAIDKEMIELDGTANKSKIGANAILSVSLAVAVASAEELGMPIYKYIGGIGGHILPVPLFNILNGGAHSDSGLDIQEFIILPAGAQNFSEALRWGSEIFHTLHDILKKDGYSVSVGDEGGFAPRLKNGEAAISYIKKAIEEAGFHPGEDVFIGLDCAASSFFKEGLYRYEGKQMSSENMIDYYGELVGKYPIISIEDALSEEDWDGWIKLTEHLGGRVQLIGDDLYATNPERLRKGINLSASNAILIKLNQIGTLTETMRTIELAKRNGFHAIVSHRSGETADTFISHLVVGMNTGEIKAGASSRGERVEKYNELLRIEEDLGENATYAGKDMFRQFIEK